ncbi:MAG: phosphoglycolate phosphatase [Magnetovibrionaceae bacterium]
MMSLRAVVWDLDGTLLDSAPDLRAVLNAVIGEIGLAPFDLAEVKGMIGGGVPKLVERGLGARGLAPSPQQLADLSARFLELYAARPCRESTLFPGAEDTLRRLKAAGYAQALCTNKPEAITGLILRALGLVDCFDAVIGGDTTLERKPHPLPLRTALGQLKAGAAQAVMIGDSSADQGAARAVNCKLVLVRHGYSRVPVAELEPDALCHRLEDVPDLVAGFDLVQPMALQA